MKKVAVIYKDRSNRKAIEHLQSDLELIFSSYIFVENYYLDELPDGFEIMADAYLVGGSDVLIKVKGHLPDFERVVIMFRSLSNNNIDTVKALPAGRRVLVVNDTYVNAVAAVCLLYENGVSNIELVPFDNDNPDSEEYKSFDICITLGEMDSVPRHIANVINIGYREISFGTLVKLMAVLKLDFDQTNRNLIRYIRALYEPAQDFRNSFYNGFLKSQVLDSMMNGTDALVLVTNEKYEVIYCNRNAAQVLGISDNEMPKLSDIMEEDVLAAVVSGDPQSEFLTVRGEQYFVEKNAIMAMDETLGYSLTLRDEKSLRDIEINAKRKLRQKGLVAKYNFGDIIHDSPVMDNCINMAKTAAVTDFTVLIYGESGTGKELLAQSIHNFSRRADESFVAVNCAALPESLLESELFGYESGAFTGARKGGKLGLFEQASGGTIFLDEIGDISPQMQSRLLRVLQEKQIMRIGSDHMINIDTRIIAATNKDLRKEVENGNFRKDLYYRLNVISLSIEPLRSRKGDILPLMENFLGPKFCQLTKEDKDRIYAFDWPGNVRELESAAMYYSTLGMLPAYLYEESGADRSAVNKTAAAKYEAEASESEPPQTQPTVSAADIRTKILKVIAENTQAYHGIGRVQLGALLKDNGVIVGDSRLRSILNEYKKDGLIIVERGRSGMRITEKGQEVSARIS